MHLRKDFRTNVKMAKDNISCKKFTIQRIVDPGTFWVLEHGKETQTEPKHYISPKDIKRVTHFEQICTGQMVVVKHENEFKRGLLIDMYNRCKKAIYIVLLVDSCCSIEVSADSIFMIRNPELRNKKSNCFEILIRGVQPATMELFVGSTDNGDGIFHKRISKKWSPAAFKFIKDLFKNNSCIYVNCINVNGASITGDVYYKQEGADGLMCLAQTLCDKDFAVFSGNELKIEEFPQCEGSGIERRIPAAADTGDASWEEKKENWCAGDASDKSTCSDSDKSLKSSQVNAGGRGHLSNSWIVKKMNGNFSTSSPSFESYRRGSDVAEKIYPKVTLFRVVQRNMELYAKAKHET